MENHQKEYSYSVVAEKTESMVLCMSPWAADLLKKSKTWLFDGTFKTAPAPFEQVIFFLVKSFIGNCCKFKNNNVTRL